MQELSLSISSIFILIKEAISADSISFTVEHNQLAQKKKQKNKNHSSTPK